MSKQILIKCGKNWFEFSKSQTGQLDFVGKLENFQNIDVTDFEYLHGSTYYSPARYIFLQEELNFSSQIYVSQEIDISDKDTFDFLVHIGALLGAVEAKDSLLAGELYFWKQSSFEKFAKLTEFILEPLCVEILFSLCFGIFRNVDKYEIPLIFNLAKKKIAYEPSKENLSQAFIRYFKDKKTTVTLPVVGNNHHSWNFKSKFLDKIPSHFSSTDFIKETENFQKTKTDFYDSLKVCVQAELYNSVDENAISILIEDIDSKLSGKECFSKAGFIRATAAKIIRCAKQKKLSYEGKLVRFNYNEIVVKIDF